MIASAFDTVRRTLAVSATRQHAAEPRRVRLPIRVGGVARAVHGDI